MELPLCLSLSFSCKKALFPSPRLFSPLRFSLLLLPAKDFSCAFGEEVWSVKAEKVWVESLQGSRFVSTCPGLHAHRPLNVRSSVEEVGLCNGERKKEMRFFSFLFALFAGKGHRKSSLFVVFSSMFDRQVRKFSFPRSPLSSPVYLHPTPLLFSPH